MNFTDESAVTYNEERIVIFSKTVIYEAQDGSLHNFPLINEKSFEKESSSGEASKNTNDLEMSNS